jgi:hypothetical protein
MLRPRRALGTAAAKERAITMKTFLKSLSLFLAASVPSALAVEFVGIDLPAGLDATAAFGAFVVTLVAMIAFTDYTRARAPLTVATVPGTAASSHAGAIEKATHPLAA